jgi:hypothetical protein
MDANSIWYQLCYSQIKQTSLTLLTPTDAGFYLF